MSDAAFMGRTEGFEHIKTYTHKSKFALIQIHIVTKMMLKKIEQKLRLFQHYVYS